MFPEEPKTYVSAKDVLKIEFEMQIMGNGRRAEAIATILVAMALSVRVEFVVEAIQAAVAAVATMKERRACGPIAAGKKSS
jgi:UDP-N-acetylmuramyl pentapeptide synthase